MKAKTGLLAMRLISISSMALVAAACGQVTAPATRANTVGKITISDADVVPLEKGAKVPALRLTNPDGNAYDLQPAIAGKPAVIIFYRGGWCSYCMRQLRGMQGIVDELADAGFQLLAISPDKPEELARTIRDEQLTYTLLSDSDAAAIKAFGLAFQASPAQYKALEQYSGQSHHAIPIPAVYIIGTDGTIQFAHHDPDYRVRMTPSEVLEKAKAVLTR